MRKQEWDLARARPVSFASERLIAQVKAHREHRREVKRDFYGRAYRVRPSRSPL